MISYKHVDIEEVKEELEFVDLASKRMSDEPKMTSFGDLEEGNLVALRWGLGDDCLMVFRIADEPRIYDQVIKQNEL